ncbi:MAG: AMP-dependent synthetase [Rickettsiaceae bacterium]|jgi:long-chain acyl-CoA synthetase|nr:AMP-dependent synthetase [Rickettsiaceae bacterium]
MSKRKKEYPWEKSYPEGVNWSEEIPVAPLYSILTESAQKYPDNICIDYYGKKLTYKEVNDFSSKLARGLQEQGIKKNTRVGLLMPNCPLFIVAYYAILKAGGTVVNFNPLYTISELAEQVRDSGTTIMVTLNMRVLHEKTSNLLQSTSLEKVIMGDLRDSLPFPKDVLFGFFRSSEIANVLYGRINLNVNDLMQNRGDYSEVEIDPEEDLAVLQYTGGTTGTPKAAMLTHANLYANTVQSGMWFSGLEEGKEKMLAVLPFFHVFSMTVVMNLSVYKACEVIIHSKFDINLMLKDIERKKITLLPGVPTLFSGINNYNKVKNFKLTSLKFCMSGGAPLLEEVKNKFEELSDCILIEGYGLSETSPVVIANPLFGEQKTGSIGIPFPGTIVEIRDIVGRRSLVTKGKIGEICIRGPQVMKGYLGNEKETVNVLRSGLLHTGDMGYMDEDGYIYVVDRLKDMIICSGFNVYPREVEEAIQRHPAVEEVCVVGVGDDYRGQIVKAFIKLKLGERASKKNIMDFLDSKLANYKIPSEIEFMDSLPKTMIGKISKKELKSQESKKKVKKVA